MNEDALNPGVVDSEHRVEDPTGFTEAERETFYRILAARRDIRRFRPDAIPDDALARILWAGHHAGSVGFMQPWNFILVRDRRIRQQIKDLYVAANEQAGEVFEGERRELYGTLKLEGILECALNICVTCDTTRGGPHVLGRNSIRETDVYSTCTAIQNMWLAARAEGIGIGWVSILENGRLREVLGIPDRVIPVAFLCVGYPVAFPPIPELEACGWANRLDLMELVFEDRWPDDVDEGPRR